MTPPDLGAETTAFLVAGIGYLLGSIPFGLLLTRAAGLGDIRAIGSGNIGATNVLRTGNRWLAAATLLLDAAKGAASVLIVLAAFGERWAPLAAFGAVLGHCFPVWLGFSGGKGVATGIGALAALDWRLGVAMCAIWVGVALASRISAVGALTAFAAAPPLAVWLLPPLGWVVPLAIAATVWWRHEGNIGRILAGNEPRIGRGA